MVNLCSAAATGQLTIHNTLPDLDDALLLVPDRAMAVGFPVHLLLPDSSSGGDNGTRHFVLGTKTDNDRSYICEMQISSQIWFGSFVDISLEQPTRRLCNRIC